MALAGVAMSVGIPCVIAVIGIARFGWRGISWADVFVWGPTATAAFTLVGIISRRAGLTRFDLLDLLGSIFAEPGSTRSRALGAMIHHLNGALLAIPWAYGLRMVGMRENWLTGLACGIMLWMLAMVMLSSIGALHPAIRRGDLTNPGLAGTNFGSLTPVTSLIGHLVYGLVLGLLYQFLPLV